MARPKLILSSSSPYHVRARVNNQEWFYISKSDCWTLFAEYIQKTIDHYKILVHVFVLMDNHFHMILSTPNKNLGLAMQYLMRETSKAIGHAANRINRIYGGRYQRTVLESEHYFRNAYKYILRNPIAANLCERVEQYPYSTLQWDLNYSSPLFETSRIGEKVFQSLLPNNDEYLLKWLNTSYHPKQAEIIRKGLRRQRCKWSTHTSNKRWISEME